MSKQQLRSDLCNRVEEKFRLWLRDSQQLYEMADLPLEMAIEDTYATMINYVIQGAIQLRIKPEDLSIIMSDVHRRALKLEGISDLKPPGVL